MVRRSRDAKFVIYQVLYIFVITVLALKGAEINLGEVVKKENVVSKSVRDSLINVVDSLSKLGLKFNIEIDENVISENKDLREKLSQLNTQVASLSKKVKETPLPEPVKEKEIKKEETVPSPFSKSLEFLQYATNIAENKGDYIVSIVDPKNNSELIKVEPNSKKEFELTNQNEILIKYANQTDRVKVKNNLPPEVDIKKSTTKMDKGDIFVKDLQKTTCFTVEVRDEKIEQIKVTYSGPITVSGPQQDKKGNLVYNISLNLANTEEKFNSWADRNEQLIDSEGRYKANFFFTAFDTKSKQKTEVGEAFYFTEFSK
ncbi:MAG: hypothetical protein HYS24_07330 [Ignavibacteriales bacterium]|jgi:hypothetical protein|nr:hypothetical protein [Ignavibacteriales bacterium]